MSADRVYLEYILECISQIEDLTASGRDTFVTGKHNRAALLYYLQTMAEATQRISESLKASYLAVDWIAISGFRNRLAHGYLDINMTVVWNVVENDLPVLKNTVSEMLHDRDSKERT